jgi:hypothetical protein
MTALSLFELDYFHKAMGQTLNTVAILRTIIGGYQGLDQTQAFEILLID